MKANIGGVLGVKDSMLAHILGKGGNNPCPDVSKEAIRTAKSIKNSKRPLKTSTDNDDSDEKRPKKRVLLEKVERSAPVQSLLKVYKGPRVSFNNEQTLTV